ncbi:phosphoheptose isomerase [Gracilimonas sp.]|uniref:phosphoheptose isomerase n=1 Tax=Gracilimonas sp. TaxID=1974203 RepID=UPI002871A621|nr:phosphoheptose isomerase [Gracilimonas sp.]
MAEKKQQFHQIRETLEEKGFRISDQDLERPWGGFFVIDEKQATDFIKEFFDESALEQIKTSGKVSPKILMLAPGKRLSWQYHHRRSELWKVLDGPVGVIKSITNEQKDVKSYDVGEHIKIEQGERHRLVGLDNWGIVAEIWMHVYGDHPSDEKDIVRLKDDFGR